MNSNVIVSLLTPEEALRAIAERNKKYRVINDLLYIRASGSDPVKCFVMPEARQVYLRKKDWINASPAIKRTEACVLLRITPRHFNLRKTETGVVGKKGGRWGKMHPELPRQGMAHFYSVQDLITIARDNPYNGKETHPAGAEEIRRLFANGFVQYKRLGNGEFVPIWDESIY